MAAQLLLFASIPGPATSDTGHIQVAQDQPGMLGSNTLVSRRARKPGGLVL